MTDHERTGVTSRMRPAPGRKRPWRISDHRSFPLPVIVDHMFIDPETGDFLPMHLLPERAKASVEIYEIVERKNKDGSFTKSVKLKLVPKRGAMDMAFKILGAYADKKSEST